MSRRPSFQFYPADWRKDAELQSCSVTARGLWHEAMCIMHECEPYGELRVNGKPMSTGQLARLVGMTLAECKRALAEIETAGVSSRTEDGALYSRRMVRDQQEREKWGERQRKSRASHADVPDDVTPESRLSSSSSSPSGVKEETKKEVARKARRSPKLKTSIPDDFPGDEERRRAQAAWMKIGRPDLAASVLDEIEKFRDHHTSQAKGSADWPASWRTWIKNAPKFTPQERMNGHARRESPHEQSERIAKQLIREESGDEGADSGADCVPRIALRAAGNERR